jgi:RHS repeat-associated protein
LLGFSYTDAPSGAILAETDTPSSPQSPADYTYDSQSRVTSMTPGSGSTLNYGFDASANLTTLPPGATGTYDHAGELTSSVLSGTTTSYTYDADGERLSAKQGSTTIASGTWNGAGELTSYSNTAANMSSATYDGDGLRTSETSTPSGGSQTTQNFLWNTISAVPNLLMDSTNAYIFAGSGTPAEQVNLSTGTIVYLVADSLGSVRGAVASSGSLSGSVDYDAWGNPETAGGLGSYTPFGFAGAYTDLSGMVYLIGRYYDPQTGQFLSVDPKVQETQQAYIYASNNPVNMLDPNGLNSRGCSLLVCIEIFSQNGHGLFVTMIWIWNRPMEYLPIGTAVWYTMNQFGVPPRYVKVPNRDVGLYFTPKRDFPNKALVCGRIGDFPGFPCQTVRK